MSEILSETGGQKIPGDKGEQTVTITRIIIAATILLGGLAFIAWYFVNEHSERIKFMTVNALSLLILVVIAIQAYIYRKEWRVMEGQWQAMQESLKHAERAVEVSERNAAAAEKSVELAKETLYVGEAPYFGITNIEIINLAVGYCPQIKITFMNGGKTPAWNFYALAFIFVGYRPDVGGEKFTIQPQLGNLGDTFIPSGKEKTIHYVRTDFRLTQEQETAMRGDSPQRFFVIGTAHYRNMKGDKLWYEFCGIYYPSTGKFGDYYAT